MLEAVAQPMVPAVVVVAVPVLMGMVQRVPMVSAVLRRMVPAEARGIMASAVRAVRVQARVPARMVLPEQLIR